MKFNISVYRKVHEKAIHELYQESGPNGISLYCAVSFCPVLAAYWFCREFDSNNPELTKRIENVKLFYGVTEIIDE
jgi:hypothetical protein